MRLYKKNSKLVMVTSVLAVSAFSIYLLLAPFLNISRESLSGRHVTINPSEHSSPMKQERGTSLIAMSALENEYIVDAVTYHIMNRSPQVSSQYPNLVLYSFAVLMLSFGILIRKSRYQIKDSNHNISILAFSMGGHAPPIFER